MRILGKKVKVLKSLSDLTKKIQNGLKVDDASAKLIFSVVVGISVSLVFGIVFGWLKGTVYAQSDLVVQKASMTSSAVALPWIMGGGLASMFVGLVRINYNVCKKVFDVSVSLISFLVLSPLFVIIAILVKADSEGPVFFQQERLGLNGKPFKILKFRTMRNNAELETGPVWAKDDDPRVTKLGQFLRKSHLDELPQFINVIKGEMSLIGPRPERPEFMETIVSHVPNFGERVKVVPGITGLAQVRYHYGASIDDAAKKLRFDKFYIQKRGWLLDFQIMLWTVARVFTGEGAR
ncbi:MAG: sugar transferase [Candidatus Omnitrophica bacterium]|nr:sugar transferase [Candidatus Omnitrophota bacterium]